MLQVRCPKAVRAKPHSRKGNADDAPPNVREKTIIRLKIFGKDLFLAGLALTNG
jgi:hypothetical protein